MIPAPKITVSLAGRNISGSHDRIEAKPGTTTNDSLLAPIRFDSSRIATNAASM